MLKWKEMKHKVRSLQIANCNAGQLLKTPWISSETTILQKKSAIRSKYNLQVNKNKLRVFVLTNQDISTVSSYELQKVLCCK